MNVPPRNSPAATVPRVKTILIIDDEEVALSMYALALESKDYRVLTASSGEEGLKLARQHLPDLVLSDIHMPGVNGRTVLETLRADPEMAAKQIVLMTGNPASLPPRLGMALGADDYLVKPFSLEDLLECLEARLKRANVHWRVEDRALTNLRSTLGSTLPHEFLTPLAGILGLVEVLRDEVAVLSPEEIEDLLDDINRSGLRLHRTLKNYLFILDLQATADSAAAEPTFLSESDAKSVVLTGIESVMKRYQRQADVTVNLADCQIAGRPVEITMIVEELVDNACSFSRKGTPIQVHLDANGVLSVSDEGRGMAAEQVAHIGAFQQFDRKKYEQQGLGLGLVLVLKLMARCGGTFTVESQVGKGTTAKAAFKTPGKS
jgi:two-component system sensor histidine kinase/response regulator